MRQNHRNRLLDINGAQADEGELVDRVSVEVASERLMDYKRLVESRLLDAFERVTGSTLK